MAADFSLDRNNITKDVLQSFIVDSNEIVELKLVRTPTDIEDDSASFKPEMSHQIFGDSEQIFGYRSLQIKLYYSASRLTTYLSHTFSEKVNPEEFEGVKADEIIKPIAEKMPPGYHTNIDDFIQSLDKDGNFIPFGEMVHKFNVETENGEEREFEIYYNDISPSGFLQYHERLQTFLLWYIDASSYIDTDDERWRFFLVYEKYTVNGNPHYAIAGYTTVYEYYAYPSNIRPRISQMIILPPFQRMGLGAEMLQTIYQHYKPNPMVVDITVEDPSENFQRLRDFVDSRNCLELKGIALDELPQLTKEVQLKIQNQLKLNKRGPSSFTKPVQTQTLKLKKQIQRVYEILKLRKVNKHDDEQYRTFRLSVKNRLNSLFRKEDSDLRKLKKVLSPEELAATLSITGRDQRLETLDKLYRGLEEEYDYIVEKLNSV